VAFSKAPVPRPAQTQEVVASLCQFGAKREVPDTFSESVFRGDQDVMKA
jgi:hypothetical protein